MDRGKAYISGKLTGISPTERETLLNKAKTELLLKGFQVTEPTATEPGNLEQRKTDLLRLLDCSVIYVLSNWEHSEKAVLEHNTAKGLGLWIVYEEEPHNREIKEAIESVMGVPFRLIARDSRNRWHVYARMIYAHHCKKVGDNTQQIATETKHDESSICYYLRHYESEYKFNREFRNAAEKVGTLLSSKLRTPKGKV